MNRVPLTFAFAAVLLAIGFFALGVISGPSEEEEIGRNPGSTFAGRSSQRERPAGSRDTGDESRRRVAAGDARNGLRGSVPGREERRGTATGAAVIESERGRAGGRRAFDSADLTQRLRAMGRGPDEQGDLVAARDRLPEGLQARPELDSGSEVADEAADDPQPGDAGNAPEGKIFDPFSVYDNDRGADEQPYLIEQVDFLDGEHGVDMGDDSVLTFPTEGNISGEAGTIHFEFEPDWDGTEQSNRNLLRIDEPGKWENRVRLVKDFNYLRYMFFDDTGIEQNINTPIDNWRAGEPHDLTINWNQDTGTIAMYIDGELMAEKPYEGGLVLGSKSRIDVGSKGGDGCIGAGGTIVNLTAHDRALTPFDF